MQAMKEQSSPMADGGTSYETILKDIFARLDRNLAIQAKGYRMTSQAP